MTTNSPKTATAFELNAGNAAAYLRRRGFLPDGAQAVCRELGGGVSSAVILVETPAQRMILKQALPQLRVKDEWLADRSRSIRERNALIDAARLLPRGWVPPVLWSDEENFLYAMEPAEDPHEFWKNRLLAGRLEPELAKRAGIALGLTIRGSWRSEYFQDKYADRIVFEQLRVDPYYFTIARRHPDIAEAVNDWLAEQQGRRVALVHGDWSPKNMIVTPRGMVFIDYECAHYGDPTFDSAFCINHFLLKGFHRPELAEEYLELARVFFTWTLAALPAEALEDFEKGTARHLAFLLLARVDGKSPAEYITREERREMIRRTAKKMIHERAGALERSFALALEGMRQAR